MSGTNDNGVSEFAESLDRNYESIRVPDFESRHFNPEHFYNVLDTLTSGADRLFTVAEEGKSFEGRPIRSVKFGTGKTNVLLWSQMHGDESTATMAIADILRYVRKNAENEPLRELISKLTIHFLPMLNPDGASRTQRRTAQRIDMNRDALALVTPEANILKNMRDRVKPEFGFNLHDQELSTVASGPELSAIALLAPAFDREKSDNNVRIRAKHLAATLAKTLQGFIPGKISRYDDGFEPRAFGDNMQKWGTSTVLIESGHMMDDENKDKVRKLNFVGILSSLHAIASGVYEATDISTYEALPFNGKRALDVIIRNVSVEEGKGKLTAADLGISYQVDTHSESTPRLVDFGDLHTFIGLKEIDGKGKRILSSSLSLGNAFAPEDWLQA
jgi:hypothetical protein